LVILLTLAALPAGAELTPQEEARLASALAVIEARLGTNYAPHSNFGILLGDARAKENELAAGGRIALTIPLYERVASALLRTNAMGAGTNATVIGKGP